MGSRRGGGGEGRTPFKEAGSVRLQPPWRALPSPPTHTLGLRLHSLQQGCRRLPVGQRALPCREGVWGPRLASKQGPCRDRPRPRSAGRPSLSCRSAAVKGLHDASRRRLPATALRLLQRVRKLQMRYAGAADAGRQLSRQGGASHCRCTRQHGCWLIRSADFCSWAAGRGPSGLCEDCISTFQGDSRPGHGGQKPIACSFHLLSGPVCWLL